MSKMKRPREDGGDGLGGSAVGKAHKTAYGSSPRLTPDDALAYLREVKERFWDNRQVYECFLDLMKDFKAQRVNTTGVIKRVKELFKGHWELIVGFNAFLPKGYEIELPPQEQQNASKPPVEFDQAINYVNKIKTRFQNDEYVYKQFLEVLNLYRKGLKNIGEVYHEVASLFQNHPDLLEEFTYFLPDSKAPAQKAGMMFPKGKMKGKVPPKPRGRDDEKKNKRKKHREGRPSAGESDGSVDNDEKKSAKNTLAKEFAFFDKVKTRLKNREAYQDFLKCLNIFSQEIITRAELQGLVQDILGRHQDLLQAFNEFLTRCENMGKVPAKVIDLDAEKGKDGKGAKGDKAAKDKASSLKEKYLTRPIGELDLSNCERSGASYRLLPKNYPRGRCSGRSELANQVLNDNWVAITSGQEDSNSFKNMRKNQYEENLFRCEDDRFELDMMIETNESAVRAMTKLNDHLNTLTPEQKANFKYSNVQMNSIHKRCVERIYGDHGSDILDLLAKNPAVAVPVILTRLKQKTEEWRQVQVEMNKVWKDVYEKNYVKSLDHRSFYFKQLDKRVLSSKGLLAEIKDIAEQKKRENENVEAAATGKRPIESDLVLDYPDLELMQDMHGLLRHVAEEQLSSEQAERTIKFYSMHIEPFLGLVKKSKEIRSSVNDGDQEMEDAEKQDQEDDAGKDEEEDDSKKQSKDDGKDKDGKAGAEKIAKNLCTPIAPFFSDENVAAKAKSANCLYAHDNFYLFMRLHQTLYSRLLTGKDAAKSSTWQPKEYEDAPGPHPDVSVYNAFMDLLKGLCDQSIDISKYEDQCRAMLGSASYNLFTLDKLLYKVVKQLQALSSDDVASKLMALHEYEEARREYFVDAVYHANACVVLNEEQCYRLEFDTETKKLSIQLMDDVLDKNDLLSGSLDLNFQDYLTAFLHSQAERGEKCRVFLQRNFRKADSEEVAYAKSAIKNGLECKLAASSFKLSYVLDTEDVLYRASTSSSSKRSSRKTPRTSTTRGSKFNKWLQSNLKSSKKE
mmetsp:Transcript_2091/g.7479  ORF Transcript_2091/g.7479 Transcript_2091/m.7479 type:complete len:1018 (-) Transcript_2091:188-3241(-)